MTHESKNILALDLGGKMGVAIMPDENYVEYETINLTASKKHGANFSYLLRYLNQVFDVHNIDVVYYEDVKAHKGVAAAHAYGGYKAIVEMYCYQACIPCMAVPVGTIKKHATGKGNATKDDMIKAMKAKGRHPQDDNQADALALLDYAMTMGVDNDK